jgi:hypothetical protein
MAAVRLSGMEISDLTMELSDLRSAPSFSYLAPILRISVYLVSVSYKPCQTESPSISHLA